MSCCREKQIIELAGVATLFDAMGHVDLASRLDSAIQRKLSGPLAAVELASIATEAEVRSRGATGNGARHLREAAATLDRLVVGKQITAAWKDNPRGWDKESRRRFWQSIGGSGEHKRTLCIDNIKGHVDDPGAFCQSLYSEFEQ